MNNEKNIFIDQMKLFLKSLQGLALKEESIEWYLFNNLEKYFQSIKQAQSSEDFEGADLPSCFAIALFEKPSPRSSSI